MHPRTPTATGVLDSNTPPLAQPQDCRQVARELDLQAAVLRHQPDRLDEPAQKLRSLGPGFGAVERLVEFRDALAIDLS
jgi:hypothetical protein